MVEPAFLLNMVVVLEVVLKTPETIIRQHSSESFLFSYFLMSQNENVCHMFPSQGKRIPSREGVCP